jgi:hypothetical protein
MGQKQSSPKDSTKGINSVFQAVKAKALGYKKSKTIATVIFLLVGKLDFSKVNPYCGVTHTM